MKKCWQHNDVNFIALECRLSSLSGYFSVLDSNFHQVVYGGSDAPFKQGYITPI